ncbi:zinc finger protein Bpb1 [Schizosaccharomyces cryophilus OY26]|uniref:Branchpoint-bridging protein n=1 Tax=Schizosaccharomyces cryophilus (strain OY26 / ATCC MYA-4695 / CBS 11777 / NBRC 106824 / NRRL Y48691) TaxID=653667 RepID=S9VPQ9_SCHCR|nr:zinc finger protein Bpb1 [Schizosaccharomyces cryophilus OY26]EPY49923.1 zinc finger protein Bpb1 [Schizosaccharomyces cryophilus OY26]
MVASMYEGWCPFMLPPPTPNFFLYHSRVHKTEPLQNAESEIYGVYRFDQADQSESSYRRNENRYPEDRGRHSYRRHYWGKPTPIDEMLPSQMELELSIQSCMTNEQVEMFAMNVRLEEITQKLRTGNVVPRDRERSPSPPPQYDNHGRRLNTREIRYKKKLEDERHHIIEKAMKTVPNFKAPSDYRRPAKTQEKVYVPVQDYPEINFIGLLIGPRGHTLKDMESKSGAKIAIRGKGSVKEGKGKSDPSVRGNMEEDLHCLVSADSEDKISLAIRLIDIVIQTAASTPEGQNDLKRNQLRQLATLNGTLRDDENQVCQNCGNVGHRRYDCPERINHTLNIVCRHCGNAGHIARDCPVKNQPPVGDAAADREYQSLMQELGGGSITSSAGQHALEYTETSTTNSAAPPPWAANTGPSSESSSPAPWAKATPSVASTPAPAPWQQAVPAQPASSTSTGGLPPWQQNTQPVVSDSNLPGVPIPGMPPGLPPAPVPATAPPGLPTASTAPDMLATPMMNLPQPPMLPPGMAPPQGMPSAFSAYAAPPGMPLPGAPGVANAPGMPQSIPFGAPPGMPMPPGTSPPNP